MSRIHVPKTLLVVLATAMCTGILQANIQTSPSVTTIALACDMTAGPGPAQTVGIVLATGSTTTTVTATATVPSIVVTNTAQSVSSTTTATSFSFRIAAGCTGVTNGTPVTITFTPATGSAITVTATITITGLVLSQSSVALSCVHSGSAGSAQAVSVTSLAPGGTKFYVDQVTAPTPPAWLTISGGGAVGSQLTANATPTILTFTPAAGCSSLVVGTYSYTVQVANPGTANKTVAVTLTVGATNPLSVPAGTVMISYAKPSTATPASVTLSNANSPNAVFYLVDPTTLPSWLNVTPASQSFSTASTTLTFSPTAACAALAVGTYSASIHLKVSGSVDLVIAVSLEVQNAAPTLSVLQGTSTTINWVLGSALPTLTITPISTDEPIAFTISTTGGTFVASYTPQYGIAYNFGTPVSITFSNTAFAGAAPGTNMTETLVITPAGGTAVNFLITVNVLSPAATLTSIFPTALPVATSGSFNLTLSGSGFVTSGGTSQQTKVGIVSGGQIVTDTNIAATLVNSTTITLVITLPTSADPLLNFSAPTTVAIGVCNPNGSFCSTPTSQLTLMVGSVPIIYGITSGATYAQVTPPALTSVAPYDVLSIFGTNFCMIAAAGCTGSNSVLYGTVAANTLQYPNSLSPDGGTDKVTVGFYTHSASPSQIGSNAPLLFATNGQINVLAPSGVSAYVGQVVDIVVTYGPTSTTNKSAPYSVLIANTDPGIFTIGGDGEGPAAALDVHYNVISGSNAAHIGESSSDTIQVYVAGLGLPDATSSNTNNWGSFTCLSPAQYVTALNNAVGSSVSTADGLIMQSAITSPLGDVAPCFLSTDTAGSTTNLPTVSVGGIAATVTYAGWVADSVAGLYQINVTLPSSAGFTSNNSNFVDGSGSAVNDAALASGTTLPIVVTSRTVPSQANVTLNVKGNLTLACLVGSTACTNTVTLTKSSASWATITVLGSGGSGTYTYGAPTGLPAGLSYDTTTGAISGTVTNAGTYAVTFTGTDSTTGFTGSLTVTFVAQ